MLRAPLRRGALRPDAARYHRSKSRRSYLRPKLFLQRGDVDVGIDAVPLEQYRKSIQPFAAEHASQRAATDERKVFGAGILLDSTQKLEYPKVVEADRGDDCIDARLASKPSDRFRHGLNGQQI